MILFDVVNVGLLVIDWVQSFLQERFVVTDGFRYRNLSYWDLSVVDLEDALHDVRVGLVHCDCALKALPAYLNTKPLTPHPIPHNSNHILDPMRVHHRTPARPNSLTPINQHQRQYRHIKPWLNGHILLFQILHYMIVCLIKKITS